MAFHFLTLAFLISVLGTLNSGPGLQLLINGLVFLGLPALPILVYRRRQGAEFLERSRKPSRDITENSRITDSPIDESRSAASWMFRLWAVFLVLVYFLSLLWSKHSGASTHALRQVVAGVLMMNVLASLRLEREPLVDGLLGFGWLLWLLLFLGAFWGQIFSGLWEATTGDFFSLSAFSYEQDNAAVIVAVVGLQCWLMVLLIVSLDFQRKAAAVAGNAFLWALWGGLGSQWICLASCVATLVSLVYCLPRLKANWLWLTTVIVLCTVSFFVASEYLPIAEWLERFDSNWSAPFARPARQIEGQMAAYRFPLGTGALAHREIQSTFASPWSERPVPGGQHVLWTSDLGIIGLALSLVFIVLLAFSSRFAAYAYQELLEPSRDPERLKKLREIDYPLAPAVVPSVLMSWWLMSLIVTDIDLFRMPVFWLYLGLWVGWLCEKRKKARVRSLRWAYRTLLVSLTVLFVLVVLMKESGRYFYSHAKPALANAERRAMLVRASRWDWLNPRYPYLVGEDIFRRNNEDPAALYRGQKWVETALRLAPMEAEYHMLLSRFQRADGQYAHALLSAERAVFFAPDKPALRWELGQLYEFRGRLKSAEEQYRHYLSRNPSNVEAYLALARLAEKQKNFDEAIRLYRHVLILDRTNSVANARYSSLIAWEGTTAAAR